VHVAIKTYSLTPNPAGAVVIKIERIEENM
jgi:hypothetical protein